MMQLIKNPILKYIIKKKKKKHQLKKPKGQLIKKRIHYCMGHVGLLKKHGSTSLGLYFFFPPPRRKERSLSFVRKHCSPQVLYPQS